MVKKKLKISQLTLVSSPSSEELLNDANKLPQYIAALSSTIGSLAFGGVMGWTSAAGDGGLKLSEEYRIPITIEEFSWIGSISNLGCAMVCIPMGILMDSIGRKLSMLALIIPNIIGWGLIIFPKSVTMFCIGRFMLGLSGGALTVAIPIYTAEICEINIRGRLGSCLDLTLSTGILFSFIIGSFTTIYQLSIILSIMPIIFFIVFLFMPETPVYYLMKNDENRARDSLMRLRGAEYNVEEELKTKREALLEEAMRKGTFLKSIKSKESKNGFIIAYGLMFFQQMSGIIAIISYTASIFGEESNISPEISIIIAGSLQVCSTSISALLVDRLGRRILLITSILSMSIGTFSLGTYFYLVHINFNVSSIFWLPLVSVCLFLIMCSFGFGPIPWMMIGELFSPQIKGIAGSSACSFNWIMAFLISRFYNEIVEAFGIYSMFWIFSATCGIGVLFVIFIVPETKDKSLEEIQIELGAEVAVMKNLEKF